MIPRIIRHRAHPGERPATRSQRRYLRRLAAEQGVETPLVATVQDASDAITRLEHHRRPQQLQLEALT